MMKQNIGNEKKALKGISNSIFIIFFAISFIACNNHPRIQSSVKIIGRDTFETKTYFTSKGVKEAVISYKNSLLHGLSKTYFKDGKLQQEKTFYNGEEFGSYIEYYHDGNISRYSFLIDSVHNSYERVYDNSKKVIKVKGDPMTCAKVERFDTSDVITVRVYFSDFSCKKIDILIAESKISGYYIPLRTERDSALKFVQIGIIKVPKKIDFKYNYFFKMKLINNDDSIEHYNDKISFYVSK